MRDVPRCCSLDQLVRALRQRLRHRDIKSLRSSKLDDQLDLRGLLNWKIGDLGSLEYPLHIARRIAEDFVVAWTVCGSRSQYTAAAKEFSGPLHPRIEVKSRSTCRRWRRKYLQLRAECIWPRARAGSRSAEC